VRWKHGVAGCLALALWTGTGWAGINLYNVAGKIGLDVVQGNDTRHFYLIQTDVATLFSPRVRLELSGEIGYGADLDGSNIQALGANGMIRYLWANKRGTAFAFTGGGVGVTRLRREPLFSENYAYDTDLTLQFVLIGMEKHVFNRRVKGILEVRLVLGDQEDASALRTAVGVGFILKRPWR